jgi:endogenous inhibitor of DNA gyrase (YacG/DUF329 family)
MASQGESQDDLMECWVCGEEFAGPSGIAGHGQACKPSDSELIGELQRVADELNRTPRYNDMTEHSVAGANSFKRRFGSWNDALRAAGFTPNKEHGTAKKVECEGCGELVERTPSELERFEDHYCSQSCLTEHFSNEKFIGENNPRWEGGGVSVDCGVCGKEFNCEKSRLERSETVYCSEKCRYVGVGRRLSGENHPNWNSVKAECASCGRSFNANRSRLRDTRHVFCDYSCMGDYYSEHHTGKDSPTWNGGHVRYYGPSWPEQRRKALKRDGRVCQDCGVTEETHREQTGRGLDVHHITKFRRFGVENHVEANELSNLITLCQVATLSGKGSPSRLKERTTPEAKPSSTKYSTWRDNLQPTVLSLPDGDLVAGLDALGVPPLFGEGNFALLLDRAHLAVAQDVEHVSTVGTHSCRNSGESSMNLSHSGAFGTVHEHSRTV